MGNVKYESIQSALKNSGINFYLVSQNKTWEIERDKKILWSPKLAKNGTKNIGYESMKKVRQGDLIFNVHHQTIYSVSQAVSRAKSCKKIDSDGFDDKNNWNSDGWEIALNMVEVSFPLKPHLGFFKNHYSKAFNKNGRLNQRYLSPLDNQEVQYLINQSTEIFETVRSFISRSQRVTVNYDGNPKEFIIDKKNFSQFKTEFEEGKSSAANIASHKDYYKIFENNQIVGEMGELIIFEYLHNEYPDAKIIGRSQNLDKEDGNDNLGYDIEIIFSNGKKTLIDVKTSTVKTGDFFVSSKEKEVARQVDNDPNISYLFYYLSELKTDYGKVYLSKISLTDLKLEPASYRASPVTNMNKKIINK